MDVSRIWFSHLSDGHRRCIVEHTLNILLLPGIHAERSSWHMNAAHTFTLTSDAQRNSPSRSLHLSFSSLNGPHLPSVPTLTVPGIGLALPSPLHLKLHVITRLSFNEQGRIIHHRDAWDLKDIAGLVPGGLLTQWVASRLVAQVLSTVCRLGAWVSDEKRGEAAGASRTRGVSQ